MLHQIEFGSTKVKFGCDFMKQYKLIMDLANRNGGSVSNEMVVSSGLSRGSLKYMVDTNKIEKTSRGVYVLPGAMDDEFFNLQSRFKRGIFSLETALFLFDLTDRTPNRFSMTFPRGYNPSKAKKAGVFSITAKADLYLLGIKEVRTPSGNVVKAYCMERTLCDILLVRNKVDQGIISDAFKTYVKRKDKDIPLLSHYGGLLKVDKKLRSYLEVLL